MRWEEDERIPCGTPSRVVQYEGMPFCVIFFFVFHKAVWFLSVYAFDLLVYEMSPVLYLEHSSLLLVMDRKCG